MKYIKQCLTVIPFLTLLLVISCTSDNGILEADKKQQIPQWLLTRTLSDTGLPADYFSYTDTARLEPIITTLQSIDHEAPFMDTFCQDYGIPLWNYTDISIEDSIAYYYVPLYNKNSPLSINSIWFIYVENNIMHYVPIRRDNVYILEGGQEFIFDLLSYMVFGKENESKLIFKKEVQTRIYITITECFEVWTGPDIVHLEYQYTECRNKAIWVNTFNWMTTPIGPDGSGGGGGSTGTGSAGLGNGTGADGQLSHGIFQNSNLSEDSWKVIEGMLEHIIDNCMGESLYTNIKNILAGDKIEIQFVLGNESAYDLNSKTLSLGVDLLENNILFHEMWHLYQSCKETISSFKEAKLNMEIETRYAQYLFLTQQPYYEGSMWQREHTRSPIGNAMIHLNKIIDKQGKLRPDTNMDFLDVYLNHTVIPVFKGIPEYSSYPWDENRPPLSNFTNLNHLTKNCNE